MMGSETDDIINELFKPLLQNYQKGSEKYMRGNEFVRNSLDILYHHLHKISLKRGKSYIDSPERLKNKKAAINPQSKDNMSVLNMQYWSH